MQQVKFVPVEDREAWETFLANHPEANFLQSWAWGEFQERLGRRIYRLGLHKGKQLEGVLLAVVENAKRGRFITIAGGPIIDWSNDAHVQAFRSAIDEIGRESKAVFVRVRPQVVSSDESKAQFKSLGFRQAAMHLSAELTSQLDIRPSEDELLAGMRKNTRYEVRQAIKRGIVIEASDDPKQLKKFYDIQIQTAQRQKFVPFSYKFLNTQFEAFQEQGNVLLYTATLEGKLIAQAFIIFYGEEAAYHYGASTELGRKEPGAYLIQWEAIREAKRRGMSRYNFWGVAPAGETQHRFHGVSVFKRGFGGEDTEYLHAQDYVMSQSRYFINRTIESVRKRLRHL
jgi:lipid II:glycine glycyltransferase (peptidoglycan interpeptide bridge formation enzyme)